MHTLTQPKKWLCLRNLREQSDRPSNQGRDSTKLETLDVLSLSRVLSHVVTSRFCRKTALNTTACPVGHVAHLVGPGVVVQTQQERPKSLAYLHWLPRKVTVSRQSHQFSPC